MKFILLATKKIDIKEFINFWSQFYIDFTNRKEQKKENKYLDNINKKLDKDSLLALYEWKNGSKLSERKRISFEEKILSKLGLINSLKSLKISTDFELEKFKEEFQKVSTIWKIFLLHIIKPNVYPIFDQHVYRAFSYMECSTIRELPSGNSKKSEKEKEKIYFKEYLPFFIKIRRQHLIKELDESLWSFGKFLKSNYGGMVISGDNKNCY